jgi:hypothetical protein
MNKNTPILTCDIDDVTAVIEKPRDMVNLKYLPPGVGMRIGELRRDLNLWWSRRSIPASRKNLKDALGDLNVKSKNELLVKALGLSLSDQYWINPEGRLNWADVNFFDNSFSDDVGDILMRQPDASLNPDLRSPDNTSDGVLKKRWKIIDGTRVLIKGGSGTEEQEPINEVFISRIIHRLGYDNYVRYRLSFIDGSPCSLCNNFITPDTEFVSAERIMDTFDKSAETSLYQHFLNCCKRLDVPDPESHLNFMLALDYLVRNTDRHIGNFGVIRDVNTLRFIGLAPIFDNGTSLWNQESVNNIDPYENYSAKPFDRSSIGQLKLVRTFIDFDISKMHAMQSEFFDILGQSSTISEERRHVLSDAFGKRVAHMEKLMEEIERSRFTHSSAVDDG